MPEVISSHLIPILWLSGGILLILLEVVVPGAVLVFFGVSALITSFFIYAGIIASHTQAFLFWSAASLVLALFFRRYIHKWFPALERYSPVSEAAEFLWKETEVIADVFPDKDTGRVRFQGTTWNAKSNKVIPAGSKAYIVGKKNITLFIDDSLPQRK